MTQPDARLIVFSVYPEISMPAQAASATRINSRYHAKSIGTPATGTGEEQELAAHDDAYSSRQRGNSERPDTCRRTRRTLAFATLPFGADQKADPKGNGEI
jgi:hypothetical protein